MTTTKIRAIFLGAAAVSLVLAVSLWFGGNKDQGAFVGLWVPSILALGAFMAASQPTFQPAFAEEEEE